MSFYYLSYSLKSRNFIYVIKIIIKFKNTMKYESIPPQNITLFLIKKIFRCKENKNSYLSWILVMEENYNKFQHQIHFYAMCKKIY